MSSADALTSLVSDGRTELREGYADVGEVRLHYVEAGDGPLIVLLHGFPEFWYGWRLQIAPLVAAGFRVTLHRRPNCARLRPLPASGCPGDGGWSPCSLQWVSMSAL
jgi:pimeloyl-ACP methyl ester carboxylesterase